MIEEVRKTIESELKIYTTKGPFWNNGCSHEGYITSFQTAYSSNGHTICEKIDLYVWENEHSTYKQEVCLRFGNEDGDYRSPGKPSSVIKNSNHEPYTTAARILELLGFFKWEPDKEKLEILDRLS